jgi:hypothetical protein
MTTVADLIRVAFRRIGVLAAEETPSAAEQSDAFDILNDMLASWAGEKLLLFATQRSTYPLTPTLQPQTIGVGGTFNTSRPVRIERASIVSAGSETPLCILSDAEWQNLQGKTSAGRPVSLWVDATYPLMGLWLNPIPNVADTLVLYTWQQLNSFVTATDSFDLPPGYRRAIRDNLAIELAPEFGVTVSAELANSADAAKTNLKRLNMQKSYLRSDAALLSGGGFNLYSGDG